MADQQPGDPTPAAGMPDPTRFAGTGGPPTADVPAWWSGAAPVPEPSQRRSLWSRMVDRINGAAVAGPVDDRTAIPAVDPWADQDTPVWPEAYTSPAAPPPLTRIDNPTAAPHPAPVPASQPASATPGITPSTLPAPGTYPPPSGGTGLPPQAPPAPLAPPTPQIPPTPQASPTPLVPPRIRAWGHRAASKGQQAAAEAPDRLRSLGRQAAAKGQQVAAEAPGRLRTLRRQAAATGQRAATRGRQVAAGAPGGLRLLSRRPASAAAPRVPVQPRTPLATRRTPGRPRPRRRLRRLGLFLVVVTVLAGAYWYLPSLRQYPVTAVLPDSFLDLSLRDNETGRRAAQRLAEQLQGAQDDTFAGVYTDARGKRVTVFGVTGLRLTPGADVDAQLSRLADTLSLRDVESFDLGEFGAHQRCGTGRLDGTAVVACAWADHGSLATVLLTRRSLTESADLVAGLRKSVLTPG